jgi:DNA polymerase-3 subunit epsilon
MKMKTIFFDVETSGVDYKVNGLLQIAGLVECEGEESYEFNYFMKPFPDQIIEDGALEANGITRSQIESFADPFQCYLQFTQMLKRYVDRFDRTDKITLIGYNSRFDDDFMREWFRRCHDKFYGAYFFWPAIDVANMVAVKYRQVRNQFPNFQLMTVAKHLKIDVDESKAHDAVYDTLVTKAVYEKCIGSH